MANKLKKLELFSKTLFKQSRQLLRFYSVAVK